MHNDTRQFGGTSITLIWNVISMTFNVCVLLRFRELICVCTTIWNGLLKLFVVGRGIRIIPIGLEQAFEEWPSGPLVYTFECSQLCPTACSQLCPTTTRCKVRNQLEISAIDCTCISKTCRIQSKGDFSRISCSKICSKSAVRVRVLSIE